MPVGIYTRTPEHKAKIRIAAINRLKNPVERAKIGNGLRGKHHTKSEIGRHNISIGHIKFTIPKSELQYRYCELGLSTIDISKEYNCHNSTIRQKLLEYNIPVRSIDEATKMPAHRQKIKENNTGKKRTLEQCRKFSLVQKKRFENLEERNKIRTIVLEHWGNPENKMRRSGENAWNWRGGIAFEPYSPEFSDELKNYIRFRDNYTCQLCERRENGRKLDCHHIDYNKKYNSHSNLISLCTTCNNKVNFNRNFWKYYFIRLLYSKGF